MKTFAENYAKATNTFFSIQPEITDAVILGLAFHKETLGMPLCPCRFYEDKEDESNLAYWNCPCVPMRERKECHCMLFLSEESDFASKKQKFS